jgi:hypothetical protein
MAWDTSIATALAVPHRLDFEGCELLHEHGQRTIEAWGGRPIDLEAVSDVLVATEIARATKTFGAVIELCRFGYADQGLMLYRSMFEGMAVAHWVTVEPDEAASRFIDHGVHTKLVWADAFRNHGWEIDESLPPKVTTDERQRLDKLFGGPHGPNHWSGLNVWQLVNKVEHLWTDERGQRELRMHFGIAYRHANQILHATYDSVRQTIAAHEEEAIRIAYGATDANIGECLSAAEWAYGQTLSLVIDTFELPDRKEFERVFRLTESLLRTLTESEVEGLGRNDRCPCGSGRKFKVCHDGLPVRPDE